MTAAHSGAVVVRPPQRREPLLCIETSCDDTSAAVVAGDRVLSSIVSSQNELHAQFGGVVPEVASRRHTELLDAVVAEALGAAGVTWDDLAGVAVTVGPGLIGALLVGLAAAKAIAYRRRLPLVPVDHIQGHIAANYAVGVRAPFVCLVASGGHTLLAVVDDGVAYRLAARTLDDAAGEAFDKGARLLGLGYPGGAQLDHLAAAGDAGYARFPRALPRGADFSFSGLKTALLYYLRDQEPASVEAHRADIAAGYQAAIVRQLADKTLRCAEAEGLRRVAVAGGVAANSALRREMERRCGERGLELSLPALSLCTDNAAMVGLAAGRLPALPWPDYLALDAYASGSGQTGRPAPPRHRLVTPGSPRQYEPLTVTAGERAQIEAQLVASFGLTPSGARAWVDTSLRNGVYFGRKDGERVAASFAAETLAFAHGDERRRAVLLQSHYVHPDYRGQGYGIRRHDLDALLARFVADVVVLSLYDDGLVPYWERCGFVVEQRAEVVALSHCLERQRRLFHPVFTDAYVAEKLHEAAAEGAEVVRADGIVAVRARGSSEAGELLVVDAALAAAPAGAADLQVALRTIMSYPAAIGLFCSLDV